MDSYTDVRAWNLGPLMYKKVGRIGFVGTLHCRFKWIGKLWAFEVFGRHITLRRGN